VEVRFPIFGRVWIPTTSDLAARVLKGSETFTMRKNGAVAGLRWWMPAWVRALAVSMLSMDEPDHTRLRSIVDEAFRRRAVLGMEPRILAIADELAAELFADGGPADLVERYARKLPLSVICELLGLPDADRPRFIAWAQSLTRLTGMVSFLRMIAGIRPMKHYLEGRLQAARDTGGEGLIAELVRVEKEGGRISGQEMVAMVFLLLGAGSETTTHLISGSVYELIRAPDLRDWLEEDWSLTPLAIEEFLRFVSPVQFSKPRFVRREVELGGVRLKKGDRIMAMLAAANMDPEANPHPEKLDLARRPNRHLSFGTGIHFCLGHQLARMEGSVRWRRCSSAGRGSGWLSRRTPFVGGRGLASELLRRFPSRSTRNDLSSRGFFLARPRSGDQPTAADSAELPLDRVGWSVRVPPPGANLNHWYQPSDVDREAGSFDPGTRG
jgi:cytochrome P450